MGERYETCGGHTSEPLQVGSDSADAPESCARPANAIEDATVAHLEDWLAA